MFFLNIDGAEEAAAAATFDVAAMGDVISNMSTSQIIDKIVEVTMSVGLKILLAIVVYTVGSWLIKRVESICATIFTKRKLDVSLSKFILSLISISLSLCLILATIGILGIDTTSFIAIFASAGLAVGMALSGTLQNFAGGVMILFLKPYKIGDVIEAQGFTGSVKEISLFNTLLNTPDNKMIIIPNGPVSTGVINNYSKESTRRVDWTFGVAYDSDYDFVSSVLNDIVSNHELALKEPGVFIGLNEFGDSSVDIVVRAWVKSSDYWTLYFDVNRTVFIRFNEEGIEFPFPQMDVHMDKAN